MRSGEEGREESRSKLNIYLSQNELIDGSEIDDKKTPFIII
jgi:hypothetical protein